MSEPEKPLKTLFVPKQLDDLGLSLPEFRIFCRISRREECKEAVPNMARGCRMHKQTAWASLARLEELHMISREAQHGQPTLFRVRPPEEWITSTNPTETETRPKRGPGSLNRSDPTETETLHPTETETHKGSPIKVPLKGKRVRAVFIKPSVEEVQAYFLSEGVQLSEAQRFHDYHESKGWVVGKAPMKSWQAACGTWKGNIVRFGNASSLTASTLPLSPAEDDRRIIAQTL